MEVLHSIVKAYIETGEPVASKTISRRERHRLSPASIRNIMADLCEEGYLTQPHTSAGRLPTEKAFRNYVHSLTADRLPPMDSARIHAGLSEADTVSERTECLSHMLTEMTTHIGIAAAIPSSSRTLDRIELLTLADRRVLMIVVTRDHTVRNRVVALDEPVSEAELNSVRNYVNFHFSGWTLSAARRELERRLEAASAAYDQLLRKLNLFCGRGLFDIDFTPEVFMDGALNMVGLDLHLTREKMRDLLHTLEEKKRILQLLDRFLDLPAGELDVHVGLGEAHPMMKELSLIGISVPLPSGLAAKIAVLGPMWMDYAQAMSAVLHLGRVLQSLPA
jgi:heat-inducible transcriptional repressor